MDHYVFSLNLSENALDAHAKITAKWSPVNMLTCHTYLDLCEEQEENADKDTVAQFNVKDKIMCIDVWRWWDLWRVSKTYGISGFINKNNCI